MYQFFSDTPVQTGDRYTLTQDQAHHARVLRLLEETVRIVHAGKGWYGTISRTSNGYEVLIEQEDDKSRELASEVILAMALIKRDKFELVLQKAAELGVTRIIPFVSERCVIRLDRKSSTRMLERWQAILEEASAQCKRDVIPVIDDTLTFAQVQKIQADHRYFGYENGYERSPMLGEAFKSGSQLVLIGPEGGLSDAECEALQKAGYTMVSFGRRILRAETAAIYAMSVISDAMERTE